MRLCKITSIYLTYLFNYCGHNNGGMAQDLRGAMATITGGIGGEWCEYMRGEGGRGGERRGERRVGVGMT